MGSGIAQVAAVAGHDVVLRDVTTRRSQRGLEGIRSSLDRFVAKERITAEDAAAALGRITTTTDLDAAGGRRRRRRGRLREHRGQARGLPRARPDLSRRSRARDQHQAIPITSIAAVTARPEAVVGTHFFSPVPMMAAVRAGPRLKTSDETLAAARAFAESARQDLRRRQPRRRRVRHHPADLRRWRWRPSGSSRAASRRPRTSTRRAGSGSATRWARWPRPTSPAVDILRDASLNIYTDTADEKFFPPESLSRMVAAGDLGRKSGRGFYTYDA